MIVCSCIFEGSSPFDAPLSPQKIDDSFENDDSCVIPEIHVRRSSNHMILDELENGKVLLFQVGLRSWIFFSKRPSFSFLGVVVDDQLEVDLAAQLRVSMDLSHCQSGSSFSQYIYLLFYL